MKAAFSSEVSVHVYQGMWCHIPEDCYCLIVETFAATSEIWCYKASHRMADNPKTVFFR